MHLYHHICYFVVSCLFLLCHSWSLWHCFVLLSEKIQFLSKGFTFLTISKFSHVRFCLFVAWNFHTVVFFFQFCFPIVLVLLMFVLSVFFLVTLISLPLHFFMLSLSHCIDTSMLSLMHTSPLPPSFLDTYSLRYLWDIRPYALSWVFLFCAPFVEVLLLSSLRMVPNILQEEQLWYLPLWWDFCYEVWF